MRIFLLSLFCLFPLATSADLLDAPTWRSYQAQEGALTQFFRPGAHNEYITRLGEQLVRKGFGTYYTTGPGPRWGEADRRGVEAFQRSQGWRGGAADGFPGPETWRRLFA